MFKVALQAGHENAKANIDPNLRGSTGAGNEAVWTPLVRNAISQRLIKKGIQVFLFDATANSDPAADQDFDLFLALHWDANIYKGKGGGFADFPEPSTDKATKRSQEIAKIINESYFPQTNIEFHPERSNKNTRYYYVWSELTASTPCVLLECGTNEIDRLHERVEEVAEAIAQSIFKAFKLEDPKPVPPPQPSQSELEVVELKKQLDILTVKANLSDTQLAKALDKLAKVKDIVLT